MAHTFDINIGPKKVEGHNANISNQIAALNSKIESYKSVQINATSISSQLENLSVDASAAGASLENIIVSGRPIDNEDAFLSISKNLKSMSGEFTNIANVCTRKISEIEEKIDWLKTQYL